MKKIAVLSLIVLLGSLVPAAPRSLVQAQSVSGEYLFYDVYTSHANYEAIKYLKENSVIKGYEDGTFRPESTVNRAEFTKMIVGTVISNPVGSKCFSDVGSEWFASFVCEAKNRGIVSGYDDGTFRPNNPITFSEASKIVVNTLNVTKGEADANTWYKTYMTGLQNRKAIPLSIEFFDEDITRGELSEMLWRIKTSNTEHASRTYEEITGEKFATVDSCQELQERMNYTSAYGPMYHDMMKSMSPAPASTEAATSGVTMDYSTTNIQVEGVDEADVIKNDGKYIYLLKGSSIRIVEAYPSDNMKELVKLKMGTSEETFYPFEMYLNGNTLVVLGSYYQAYPTTSDTSTKMIAPYYGMSRTKVYVLDITDKSNPKVTRQVEFDGDYRTSRRIDNKLYLVMNRYVGPVYYYGYGVPAENGNTNANPEDILPKMKDSRSNQEENIVGCSDVIFFPKTNTYNFLIVAAIPLNDPTQAVSRKVIVGNSDNVYVSKDNMYVASMDWRGSFFRAPDYDMEKTVVYKFGFENGGISFQNKAEMEGRVLNQFSMDEYEGNFRIATTEGNTWSSDKPMTNNLFVFDARMNRVGAIENLAEGESIYSARFLGKRGYMVTFRQVDPLFVLNLTDPRNPKVEGAIKIPGYSTYLHPYDENHIIGFGTDVTEPTDGAAVTWQDMGGMKLSMFDVTDWTSPKELFTEVIGEQGTTSDLLYNHKALLFDKTKNLMAFPISVTAKTTTPSCTGYNYDSCPTTCQKACVPTSCTEQNGVQVCTTDCNGANSCFSYDDMYPKTVFQGAYVYNIDLASGFRLKGKISHYTDAELLQFSNTDYSSPSYVYPDYNKMIQRIIFIGENLYTISQAMVKANDMSTLAEKKSILLGGE